ncbi:hypothetical protein WN72_10695 [Bradyrhizobium arachidis]|uniref:Uncharacterized protein n=1 Tax=Bradyrhizobium arachidis TaxID=858423 RepID=A0AAE7TF36_9BRAD|nr:hypothetical protein [Bradyrhizobium sp. CCBAU 21360]QOZ66742.1 hypothetical protein WN72_10695 [Bradyrhizobium arachidis]
MAQGERPVHERLHLEHLIADRHFSSDLRVVPLGLTELELDEANIHVPSSGILRDRKQGQVQIMSG